MGGAVVQYKCTKLGNIQAVSTVSFCPNLDYAVPMDSGVALIPGTSGRQNSKNMPRFQKIDVPEGTVIPEIQMRTDILRFIQTARKRA